MSHFRKPVLALPVFLLLTACSLGGLLGPKFTNHPRPSLPALDTSPFLDAGCENGLCPPESPLGQLGCSRIYAPGEYLGGLQPGLPVNLCAVDGIQMPLQAGEYFYNDGCMRPEFVRYMVWRDGQFVLLKNLAGLQQAFAPVETENEAFSYAIAATGLGARFGLQYEPGLRYFVAEIQDTFVEKTADGYQVHLFDYQICGCGPHSHSAVDVLVTQDGQVRLLSEDVIFEDPDEDGLCVD